MPDERWDLHTKEHEHDADYADVTEPIAVAHRDDTTNVHDHGQLAGLADDDHPQYATNTEFDDHDARHETGGADALDPRAFGESWTVPAGGKYETFSRQHINNGAGAVTAARVQSVAIWLPKGLTVTSISFVCGSTALTPGTGCLQFFGLYDSSAARLAVTADDGSNPWAIRTVKTLALSPSPFVTTYAGIHYLALLVDSKTGAGGVQPTLCCFSNAANNINDVAPILSGLGNTGQATLPDPISMASNPNLIQYAFVS